MANLRDISEDQEPLDNDLHAALSAAYDAAPETPEAPKEIPPIVPLEAKSTTAVRGDNGRFVAKTDANIAAAAATADSGKVATTGSETDSTVTRKPPASWSPDQHERWAGLDPAIQDYVLKRETDYSKAIEERAVKLKQFEDQGRDRSELDRILTPYRQRWALAGQSDHQMIQKVLAAQELLNRNPAEGIRYLTSEFRLNPAQVFAAAQNQQQGQPNPFAEQLAQLEQRMAARDAADAEREKNIQTEQSAVIQTEIDAFKADPAHTHFDAVKDDMAFFLGNQRAETLQDAYDKAVRLNPTLNQQTFDEQVAARAKNAAGQGTDAKAKAEADRVKAAAAVAKAKVAASSVRGGSPVGGNVNAPKATLREELEANWID